MSSLLRRYLIILFLLLVSSLYSQEEIPGKELSGDKGFYQEGWDFKFSGYVKNILMYQEKSQFYTDVLLPPERKKMISDMNRFRLSPEINYSESITLHADMDFETVATNYNRTDEFDSLWKESDYNDIVKPSWEAFDTGDIYGRAEFQNLYAKGVAGKFTVTAGRQQVRFGSSRLWNPLDLMNPLSPLSIEGSGEQKGTDALRIDWYPGESTEFTGVGAPKREDDSYGKIKGSSGNYIARLKTGVKEFDAALLVGYTAKRKNAGADFAAELNDGLLTGVILYSAPDRGKHYYQCGSGYEYTFASGVYFLVEYFYNSLPVNDDGELQAALYHYSAAGVDESNYYVLSNRIITYNRHYLSAAAGYDFFPLLRGELFTIYDFQGRGVFLNSSLKFNVMENLDVTLGVISAFVNETDRASEFISYDREPLFYGSLQFYF